MDKSRSDEAYIRIALKEAVKAQEKGEVPVGAIIIKEGEIISKAYNRPLSLSDPTAHAEILAIRRACRKLNNYRLNGCILYVTLEPCAMCLGAMIQARISRLVFGAKDPKGGAVESIISFPLEKLNHSFEIRGGVLAEECGKILVDFFKAKRENKSFE
ncbi:MAG: tRNA adenosine(34) deaminase TadA [Acidobacteriota bacterium]